MDYETRIEIKQYYPHGDVYYTLKVTDVINMDYYYDGSAPTLDDAMSSIKSFLKRHQN
jgi:hypothetical protein